jgi:hypothetical protein
MSFGLFEEGMPTKFQVIVNCTSEDGHDCPERLFRFDFGSKEAQILPPSGVDEYAKKISDQLEEISKSLQQFTRRGQIMLSASINSTKSIREVLFSGCLLRIKSVNNDTL